MTAAGRAARKRLERLDDVAHTGAAANGSALAIGRAGLLRGVGGVVDAAFSTERATISATPCVRSVQCSEKREGSRIRVKEPKVRAAC